MTTAFPTLSDRAGGVSWCDGRVERALPGVEPGLPAVRLLWRGLAHRAAHRRRGAGPRLQAMVPPCEIWQCGEGHLLCGACRLNPALTACPVCRGAWSRGC